MPPSDWPPDRIRALRKRLGLNQTRMADAMGYGSQSRVSELEKGHVEVTGPTSRVLDFLDAHGVLHSEPQAGPTATEAGSQKRRTSDPENPGEPG